MPIRVVANRYELESEIGRGGMAVVYRARDMRLNRHVAFKLLHPYLATQAESAARFLREAEAIAKLHHSNIVEIFDAGSDEETGSQFLVMELIEGTTLRTFIEQTPCKIPEIAFAMLCCLCDAIEHAHHAGIIHRDIKPENIMFSDDGQIKLMDFGIARILEADRMTASGSLMGSPAHMPPEIIEGQSYTFSCDIFSLGTVLYYALTQDLPFRGATPMAMFKAIMDGNYQAPSRISQTVTKKMDAVVSKCLKTNPSERYQNIAALRADLLEILKAVKFDDYASIIKEYCTNPSGFYDKHMQIVKSCLYSSAQIAVQTRRLPVALECLNCILAYDSEDAQAIALLRKLRTGDALKKRVILGVVICLALALIVGIIYMSWRTDSPSLPDSPPLVLEDPTEQGQLNIPLVAPNLTSQEPTETNASKTTHWRWHYIARMMPPTDNVSPPNDIDTLPSEELAIRPTPPVAAPKEETKRVIEAPETLESASKSKDRVPSLRLKTPKKTTVAQAEAPSPETESQTSPQTDETDPQSPENIENLGTKPTPWVKLTQPVFPPDAYAVINGQRYAANSSGDIELLLAPGHYRMQMTCNRRCIHQTIDLHVTADDHNTSREIISLEWANATLSLTGPADKGFYYVARRLDDRSQRVYHLVPRTPNAISGFNTFGKPVQLEVYAIPTTNTLKSYDATALELAKHASTQISLAPGDNKSIHF